MSIIVEKKRNKIESYFFNMDWKKATVTQMYFYVKMMEYPMLLEACVYFNNIWQKHFKNERAIFKEKIECSKKLQYLLDEAVLRRGKKLKLTQKQFKEKYKKLRGDLDWFLQSQEHFKRHQSFDRK